MDFEKQLARRGEKAGQRIGELLAEQEIDQPVAVVRQVLAEIRRQAFGATARQELRPRHDVGAALQFLEHPRNQGRIVLKIPIHDDDDVAMRRLHAPLDGGAQPAVLHALQASDVVALQAQPAHDIGRAVGRVVVDDDQLPGSAGKDLRETVMEHRYVSRLVVGGHDDRDQAGRHGLATASRRLPHPRCPNRASRA